MISGMAIHRQLFEGRPDPGAATAADDTGRGLREAPRPSRGT
jgi:hypothetical protein